MGSLLGTILYLKLHEVRNTAFCHCFLDDQMMEDDCPNTCPAVLCWLSAGLPQGPRPASGKGTAVVLSQFSRDRCSAELPHCLLQPAHCRVQVLSAQAGHPAVRVRFDFSKTTFGGKDEKERQANIESRVALPDCSCTHLWSARKQQPSIL